ncbi:MAG TPA: VacJ family lipoprotein [Alphaproteobacteria bacterium]
MKKIIFLLSAVAMLGLSAQVEAREPSSAYTTMQADSDTATYTYDPLEPFNRSVFWFNKYVDMLLIKPVAQGYKWAVPYPVRTGVHNFLGNLAAPVSFLNEILQGDFAGADIVIRRFVMNTLFGMGGFIDAAEMHGVGPIAREDFGQTLGAWGVGPGPYLVLPIIGPSNLRDVTGRVVDIFTDPLNLWAMDQNHDWIPISRAILSGIDTRASLLGPYDDIMKNSVDPYSSFRSIYSQNRSFAVGDRVYTEGGAMDDYTMTESAN